MVMRQRPGFESTLFFCVTTATVSAVMLYVGWTTDPLGTSSQAGGPSLARAISRQTFLRRAVGVAATGALLGPGCASSGRGAPGWRVLGDAIEGSVLLPSDSEYGTARSLFNTRYAGASPAAVVSVDSTADVQKVMEFASRNKIKVAARSGGHSYVGASAADGAVVVDLRRLPGGVSYEAGSELATIAAGADLDTVHSALAAHGRSLPTGSCLTVGMSGLALGGGLGIDSRRYGLSCDMLTSATVVLPKGEVVTAAPGDHDDLYWALRGGGGGNFGVTTSMTFRTHAIEDRGVASLTFGGPDTAQAITGWHTWLTASDRTVWSYFDVNASPTGELRCTIGLAAPPGAGPRAAADLIAAIGLQPRDTASGTLAHMDLVRLMGGGVEWSRPRSFVAGSDVLADLTPTAAQSIATGMVAWPRATGFAEVQIKPLDGAVADTAPDATAFPWRRHAVCLQWYAITPSSAAVNAATQWLATAHQAVQPHSVGGYINYVEPDTAAAWYFGTNLGRLSSIRQKYDPAGVMYSGLNF
jgi:FAD/FMN-containing dehydrogenase